MSTILLRSVPKTAQYVNNIVLQRQTCCTLNTRINFHTVNDNNSAHSKNSNGYNNNYKQNYNRNNKTRVRATAFGIAFTAAAAVLTTSDSDSKKDSSGKVDYKSVREAIANLLDVEGYDDGSYGPLFVRLAWHASGTYSAIDKSGGSNGGCMRFEPESKWGANSGLQIAREVLEKVKKQHPGISYADLYTLAGVVAIEEMGGPEIKWRPGRTDHVDGSKSPADGRLPDAAQGAAHIRDIFCRMGFNDREIVALIGAHSFGRCHRDRSGFDGPWTRAPTTFSNEFYRVLLEDKWTVRKWSGPVQYENATKDLMMLPADMALLTDSEFRKYVELYVKDDEAFRKDFAKAFAHLLELGVEFPGDHSHGTAPALGEKRSLWNRIFG
ncbi:unnamed protein product [Didymodactylos carnosus]|uniref:Cytochrome c peroxidase, mitochondrial n=1 Tax=Didymodactylos carnosus TaxID=1234261 RepID=A0A814H1B0_9BILA|nr:unnamed protein product [Didymodactylos carnosus]CAF1250277.1 unnamed protein product [Didymodactylos carnosus]CAF3775358.1 unnamed protein product [Didymodactylos carnosus]CAF4057840.1 unnamed protein product [Didymodactylos carnosus]